MKDIDLKAFADAHVEWIADEAEFKQQLADTKKMNPGAVEMPQEPTSAPSPGTAEEGTEKEVT